MTFQRCMLFFFLFSVILCASQAESNVARTGAGSSAAGRGTEKPQQVPYKRTVHAVWFNKKCADDESSSTGGETKIREVSISITNQINKLELFLKNHVIYLGAGADGKVERAPVEAPCHKESAAKVFCQYDTLSYLLSVQEMPPSAVSCLGPGEEFLFKRWIRLYYEIIDICCKGIIERLKPPSDGRDSNAIARNCLRLAKLMVDQIENEGSVPEYLVYSPRFVGRICILDYVIEAVQLGFSNYDCRSIERVLELYTTILHEEAVLLAKEGCFVFPTTCVIPATYCYMGVKGKRNFRVNSVFYNLILSHCYDNIYKIYKAKGLKGSMHDYFTDTFDKYFDDDEDSLNGFVFYYRLSFFSLSQIAEKFEKMYREWYLKYVRFVSQHDIEDDEIRRGMANRLKDDIFKQQVINASNKLVQEPLPISGCDLQVDSACKYMQSGKDSKGNSIEPSPSVVFHRSLHHLGPKLDSNERLRLLVERRLIQFPGWILLRTFWGGSNVKFYGMYKSVLSQIFWDVLDALPSVRAIIKKCEGEPELVFERCGEIEDEVSIEAGERIAKAMGVIQFRPPGQITGLVPVYLYDIKFERPILSE